MGDPEKRKKYDIFGEEGIEQQGMHSPFDIFKQFFGNDNNPFAEMNSGFPFENVFHQQQCAKDITITVPVRLEEMYCGGNKIIELTKMIICHTCKGTGAKSGKKITCDTCHGKGVQVIIRQLGPGMIQQQQMQCSSCKGTGKKINPSDVCAVCNGEQKIKETKNIPVFIKK